MAKLLETKLHTVRDASDDARPADLVDLAIAEAQRRLDADLRPSNRQTEREWLLNLRMLRAEISAFQRPPDSR